VTVVVASARGLLRGVSQLIEVGYAPSGRMTRD